jgi:hypothetical protein
VGGRVEVTKRTGVEVGSGPSATVTQEVKRSRRSGRIFLYISIYLVVETQAVETTLCEAPC